MVFINSCRITGFSGGCRSPHLSSNMVMFSSHLRGELSLVAALYTYVENGKERMNEKVKSRDTRGKTSVVIRQDMMVFGVGWWQKKQRDVN